MINDSELYGGDLDAWHLGNDLLRKTISKRAPFSVAVFSIWNENSQSHQNYLEALFPIS